MARWLRALATMAIVTASSRAFAEVSEATPRPDEQFDFMNLLAHHGLHDLKNERWNAYGQFTYISHWKLPFSAAYTNLGGGNRSLVTSAERSFTATATLFLGVKLWPGGEAYFVPEVLSMQPLSNLTGLASTIQNAELQKGGGTTPQLYQSRAFIQQTINLGGARVEKPSDPMQLAAEVDSRRLVLRVGNFSIIDFFDKNSFAGDLRQQFLSMAFLTYAAYDFAADARGYSYGGVAELYWDDWALRVGRMAPPQDPNQTALDFRLDRYYGDQAELEHRHALFGQEGVVRLLAFRNRENMGRFSDAVAAYEADPLGKNATTCKSFNYGSANPNAPDLCWARKTNVKVGIGLNVEQHVTKDVGVFARGMIADGRTEVYSFMSSDASLSFGALARGAPWHRPKDLAGVGVGLSWISRDHARYLRAGGVDGFIGDGSIAADTESVIEAFYSVNFLSSSWFTVDYQHITNPAYNADRGPVDVLGGRLHVEF